eukprot:6182769-Pleurochrysis_carterae.AAC.1
MAVHHTTGAVQMLRQVQLLTADSDRTILDTTDATVLSAPFTNTRDRKRGGLCFRLSIRRERQAACEAARACLPAARAAWPPCCRAPRPSWQLRTAASAPPSRPRPQRAKPAPLSPTALPAPPRSRPSPAPRAAARPVAATPPRAPPHAAAPPRAERGRRSSDPHEPGDVAQNKRKKGS